MAQSSDTKRNLWVSVMTVIGLFGVGFLLRAIGIEYGYYHGDERINEAARVLTGQLVPGAHYYPPLVHYLNAVGFGVLFALGIPLDMWSSTGEFRAQYFEDPTPFYLTARYITAALGALLAPLFYGSARALGQGRAVSIAVGLAGAAFPLGVYMGHIAKGDTALATFTVATVWAILTRLQTERRARWDVITGVCAVLALSFKVSAVFVLAPLAAGLIVSLARREGMGAALGSFGRALLAILILWPILNIGILLDLANFVEFQRIQAVMSLTEADSPWDPFVLALQNGAALSLGISPVWLVAGLIAPVLLWSRFTTLPALDMLTWVWGAVLLATSVIVVLAGTRQPEHLLISNLAVLLLLAVLVVANIVASTQRVEFLFAATLGAALLAYGAYVPIKQALLPPVNRVVTAYLVNTHPDRRMMTSMWIPAPQRKEAQQIERDRIDRLAAKYNVVMPERSDENIIKENVPGALFFVNPPFALYGLEDIDDDDIDYEVKPYAWPLQKDEWVIDYWRPYGVDMFVVNDLDYQLNDNPAVPVRDFFQLITKECETLRHFQGHKTLYLERDVTVIDCRDWIASL